MEFPAWFQRAMQQRLDHVSARIERDPALLPLRVEEDSAFDAMFSGVDKLQLPGFSVWEDQHHFRRALENERLYMQGIQDGIHLMLTLFSDPVEESEEKIVSEEKPE